MRRVALLIAILLGCLALLTGGWVAFEGDDDLDDDLALGHEGSPALEPHLASHLPARTEPILTLARAGDTARPRGPPTRLS